mmetsp:Transcript_11082/g.1664  ORF Transcript_11082/g.1664 Transcript_11082/m.1664 type:complete len:80 (-) Transcript_11082:759-998(-)
MPNSSSNISIDHNILSLSMLLSIFPSPFILPSIPSAIHPKSMLFVILILPFIVPSILPRIFTLPMHGIRPSKPSILSSI